MGLIWENKKRSRARRDPGRKEMAMQIYGYGYRKDCFGQRMFFEDEIDAFSAASVRLILTKGFERMYREDSFTMKAVSRSGETWAISRCPGREKNGMYTVVYSRAWNSTDPEKVVKKADIINQIVDGLE